MDTTLLNTLPLTLTQADILRDYRLALESRYVSLSGRKEVFMGKAKFGIFGDGKELPQLAMAKVFQHGDFRSGYYRDQTLMMAIGGVSIQEYFAQLYAHTDIEAEPHSGGRAMNAHFATRLLDVDGNWKNIMNSKNTAADVSSTATQMLRLLGLAYASKLYRENPDLQQFTDFSNQGNEIAFGTIGNAATSEGLFWETMNAAGVLQVPLHMSVWDDAYGISVPSEYHTIKESISKALTGFQRTLENPKGIEIFTARAWNYPELCEVYQKSAELCRTQHIPVLVHVIEVTQPQGHSTSGSHERYKSKERLEWETEFDCNKKFTEWIIENKYATPTELRAIDKEAQRTVNRAKNDAWKAYRNSIQQHIDELDAILGHLITENPRLPRLDYLQDKLMTNTHAEKGDIVRIAKKALRALRHEPPQSRLKLNAWLRQYLRKTEQEYNTFLYSESENSGMNIKVISPVYEDDSPMVDGREVLQACFDEWLAKEPRFFAFGEDVGKIGDVNQAFAGLQEKYGELRVTDTSIREASIIGQGIGAAMRGLRPLAEIQYLDYLLFGMIPIVDDLSCLHYRTAGGQKAPLIIRTRGHRLEGMFHAGSPMGMILNSMRGIYILVPRNMTQAAGMYNVLLQADNPALLIESLNGYRLKERMPKNISQFTIPLGVPEILKEGQDVTIVTYGSMCRIVMDAARQLNEIGIHVEVIDIQTLIPFDMPQIILKSIQKTNRIIFADEDVSGGASAYMMQKVIQEQDAYHYLDSKPICISAKDHRTAYASDGDYFTKPNAETIFDAVYDMMREANPTKFQPIY